MELPSDDEILTTLSTHVAYPNSDLDPMYVVNVTLQRQCEVWVRATGGEGEEILFDSYPTAPESSCLFRIPIEVVAVPASCIHYLAHMISGFNLDASLCNYLASKIASQAYGLIGRFRGFYVTANVRLVHKEVHEVTPEEIRTMFDREGVAVPRGASETALKKLEKERFYLKQNQGHGDSSSGDSCVVCLDDFSASVELTKLPCSHVFHEKCIFRWLQDSKSCPLCRTDVE
ncbi:unnamed protein product [Dovyalis caffra]|uniref:RING-type domain-containing protein n=1 Tax=Dovyalis caffra TaxID=77055 RepID=A0AAV1SEG6_9ROSI|nr:unnamed protein product [Dovyalis caffra]